MLASSGPQQCVEPVNDAEKALMGTAHYARSLGNIIQLLSSESANFRLASYYTPGTFAEYVLSPANYVTPIPEKLASADAAPMLCAGLTTYSALRKCKAKSGEWVAISGAGGGLGHLAVQIAAHAMAYRVIGIDHGSKEIFVKDCGAEVFIDMTNFSDEAIANEVKRVTGGLGASAVILCAGSNKAYGQALSMLSFGGVMVCVGMPEGQPVPISTACPGIIAAANAHIIGSTIGSQREAIEVLDFAARGIVKTRIRVEKIDKLEEVFRQMHDRTLEGRM